MQILIITKMYVIDARKYCESDHVHRYARIDCGFLSNKTKKCQLSQPTYCSSHRYHPLPLITYL